MVVIGTHALLSPDIRLDGCAVGIIDEQHRFGVSERESFARKGKAHLLAMSATPIPRTLALTLYGDLEVIALDEKPPGRNPSTPVGFTQKTGRECTPLSSGKSGGAGKRT